jgi:hypothetical protein
LLTALLAQSLLVLQEAAMMQLLPTQSCPFAQSVSATQTAHLLMVRSQSKPNDWQSLSLVQTTVGVTVVLEAELAPPAPVARPPSED